MGADGSGQLGDGGGANQLAPAQVPGQPFGGSSPVLSVGAGAADSFAVLANGDVYAFGQNNFGDLGNGTSSTGATTPTKITMPGPITAVAGGLYGTIALLADGSVATWGQPYQVGTEVDTPTRQPTPFAVTAIGMGGNTWVAVAKDPTAIALAPTSPSIAKGTTTQLTATASYPDSTTADATLAVTWTSLQPSVASVNSSGLVTGKSSGTATIRATLGTLTSNDVTVTVTTTTTSTTTTLTINKTSPQPAGTTITLTATVTANATGTVQFFDGATALGSPLTLPGSASSNKVTLGQLPAAGTRQYDATYTPTAGNGFTGSTSATVPFVVQPASADLAAAIAGPTAATVGQQVTYTVTSTNNGPDPAQGGFSVLLMTMDSTVVTKPATCLTGTTTVSGQQMRYVYCPRSAPLPSGQNTSFQATVTYANKGAHHTYGYTKSNTPDPSTANNVAPKTTTIS